MNALTFLECDIDKAEQFVSCRSVTVIVSAKEKMRVYWHNLSVTSIGAPKSGCLFEVAGLSKTIFLWWKKTLSDTFAERKVLGRLPFLFWSIRGPPSLFFAYTQHRGGLPSSSYIDSSPNLSSIEHNGHCDLSPRYKTKAIFSTSIFPS